MCTSERTTNSPPCRRLCARDREVKVSTSVEGEKLQTERRAERERSKERDDILIMTCPDIDGDAGAHVHTRFKTPCEGLY